jgi:hypothetical protein
MTAIDEAIQCDALIGGVPPRPDVPPPRTEAVGPCRA